jgi:hypothetical protein
MLSETLPTSETRTLAQRLAEGRLPVSDALRYAMMLAESLRRLHDEGRAHGALSPRCVVLKNGTLELVPGSGAITPYTAPEALEGRSVDARSDVFAFGAILYEMMTGEHAFEGVGGTLATALATATPRPSGSPAIDRLLANCLAKDPAARWPRMQKILMELKLLTVALRRAETPAAQRHTEAADAALRAEMRQLEARLAARMDAQERTMSEIRDVTTKLVEAVRGQVGVLESGMAAAQERVNRSEHNAEAVEKRVTAQFVGGLEAAGEHIAKVERDLETLRSSAAKFEKDVAVDLHDLEAAIGAQEASVQSARTAMAQTDDLVERVVEALESLQSAVLEQSEDHAPAVSQTAVA